MYPAVVNTLFGKGICPTSEIKEFEEHFQKYDEDFEYASQMPECFLRNWSKSKKWLLKLFEKVVSDAEKTNPSDTTSKVAFWTLVFILSNPSIYKKIMEDLASVFGKAGKDKIDVSEEELKKLPFIKWCTLEAIRLRSPGAITKKVVNPIKVQEANNQESLNLVSLTQESHVDREIQRVLQRICVLDSAPYSRLDMAVR
ncbi:hypothetical protein llap_20012 [Limosa lapponica baueri]|uniref:Uncharacterized protein n=1 Tax=Limosa lapponica baueri TaxID=1758121 RepID=A0A2I0T7C1_LIMLA|nr:hypothetical protein llap_20012 [Limosa lapponica baueri]